MNGLKRIYVLKSSNGNIKIGVSGDVEKRKNFFEHGSGYKIVEYKFTEPCSNAYMIENHIHKHFDTRRLKGEWFNCEFAEATAYVDEVFNKYAEFNTHEDNTLNNLKPLTEFSCINSEPEEFNTSAGEVSSLIKNVRIVMERQNSHPRKVAKQTELLLTHFGIPVIENFVETTPWEQMELAEI